MKFTKLTSALILILSFTQVTFAGGTSGNSPASGGGTSGNSVPSDNPGTNRVFRVIPFNSYLESSNLPPNLTVNFELECNQKFLKVIRNDEIDQTTGKVTIAVGGLISEINSDCGGSVQDLNADAGSTFSGRDYSIQSIQ